MRSLGLLAASQNANPERRTLAGYTCNFTVAFNPLLPGVRKGTIVVNFTPTIAPPPSASFSGTYALSVPLRNG